MPFGWIQSYHSVLQWLFKWSHVSLLMIGTRMLWRGRQHEDTQLTCWQLTCKIINRQEGAIKICCVTCASVNKFNNCPNTLFNKDTMSFAQRSLTLPLFFLSCPEVASAVGPSVSKKGGLAGKLWSLVSVRARQRER